MPEENKLTMTQEEAFNAMLEDPRAVITVQYAKDICKAFEVNFSDNLIIDPRGKRITLYKDTDAVVSIDDLSEHLAAIITGESSNEAPYLGAGRNAEHKTLANLKILGKKLGLKSTDD